MKKNLERPRGLARKAIVKAATALFLDRGLDKTSLADIASEAGLSKGTLHYHFASKDDLIFAITELHMEKISRELLRLLEPMKEDPEALFTLLMKSLLKAKDRGRLHIHLVREALAGNLELKEKIQGAYLSWESMLSDSLLSIFKDYREPGMLSRIIIALIDGLLIQELLDKESLDFTVLTEALLALNLAFVKKE